MKILAASAVGVLALAMVACAGPRGPVRPRGMPNGNPPPVSDLEQNIRLMQSYDANHDGIISHQELEAALARQFGDCDTDKDGQLNTFEMQAENDRRWRASGTGFSPLIDWNQDGIVSMAEFATTARSIFAEIDKDQDGTLSAGELRVPRRGRGRGPPPGQGRRRR